MMRASFSMITLLVCMVQMEVHAHREAHAHQAPQQTNRRVAMEAPGDLAWRNLRKNQNASKVIEEAEIARMMAPPEFDTALLEEQTSKAVQGELLEAWAELNTIGKSASREWFAEIDKPSCESCVGVIDYQRALNAAPYPKTLMLGCLVWAAVLLWIMGSTAQHFFVPSLLFWAKRLRMQPEVAGATLLAFGNGSPDIFSMMTAARRQDFPLALSEMLGANMFCLSIVSLVVILTCYLCHGDDKSSGIPVFDRSRVACTIVVYLCSMCIVALILYDGTVTVGKASLLPLLYMFYLATISFIGRTDEKAMIEPPFAHSPPPCDDTRQGSDDIVQSPSPPSNIEVPNGEIKQAKKTALKNSIAEVLKTNYVAGSCVPISSTPASAFFYLDLFWSTLVAPWRVFRMCSIPPPDSTWDSGHRILSALSPACFLVFCVVTHRAMWLSMSVTAQGTLALISIVASAAIFLCSDNGPKLPWFYPALTLFAQVSSIVWLAAAASELTSLIEAIGFDYQVSRLSLGYTAISWGGSVGDMCCMIAMVRSGQTRIAIVGLFANSLLDNLFGFGMAFVVSAYTAGGTMTLWDRGCPVELYAPVITSFCFIFVVVAFLAYLFWTGVQWPRASIAALASLYVAFLMMVVAVQHVDAPLPLTA